MDINTITFLVKSPDVVLIIMYVVVFEITRRGDHLWKTRLQIYKEIMYIYVWTEHDYWAVCWLFFFIALIIKS